MKILIDGRLYGGENAGLGRYISNLVLELSRIDKKNEYILLLRKKYFDSLELPKNWKKILADFKHYGFGEQIFLPLIIKKEDPDIVHFPHFNIPILFKGKYVVTIHDLLMHKQKGLSATTLSAPAYFTKRLAYRFAFDSAVSGASIVLVPSIAVKNELIKEYSKKVKNISDKTIVTYEGLDERISNKKEIKTDSDYFVYAGNAYPHKNLERLIEAVVQLNEARDKNKKINLLMASARNVFTKRVEKMISKLKADSFVKILGFVPDDELGSLFKNSKGFVFPSLSEGFGLPGLEAMEEGTIVLASEIPVFKEIYLGNAIYFDPHQSSSIKKAMEKVLLMTPSEREKRIKNGQEFAKQYSWTKMARQTLKVYKNEGSSSLR